MARRRVGLQVKVWFLRGEGIAPRLSKPAGTLLMTNPGDLDAAVLRFVLPVEMDDDAGQAFYHIGVSRCAAVIGGCADALDDLHHFLLRFSVIAANQNVAQRRVDVA